MSYQMSVKSLGLILLALDHLKKSEISLKLYSFFYIKVNFNNDVIWQQTFAVHDYAP